MSEQVSRARLQREWVLCAVAVAAARFVPLPIVDDLIRARATRTAVSNTWTAHRRPDNPKVIGILADDRSGVLGGLARSVLKLPVRVLLFPIRKVIRVLTAARGVSADLVGVVLLARSVDRCLSAGWFAGTDPRLLEDQARLVRRAHEQVVGRADLRVLNRAVGAVLRQIVGLRAEAEAFARRVFGRTEPIRSGTDETSGPGPTAQEKTVEQSVQQIVTVLDQPEIAAILADLDTRFDATLAAITPPALGPAAT